MTEPSTEPKWEGRDQHLIAAVAVPDGELAVTGKFMKSLQIGALLSKVMLPECAKPCTKYLLITWILGRSPAIKGRKFFNLPRTSALWIKFPAGLRPMLWHGGQRYIGRR